MLHQDCTTFIYLSSIGGYSCFAVSAEFQLREIFSCRTFFHSFFSIVSDHAEINYSDVQNSKENMRNISTAKYFAQLEIPP